MGRSRPRKVKRSRRLRMLAADDYGCYSAKLGGFADAYKQGRTRAELMQDLRQRSPKPFVPSASALDDEFTRALLKEDTKRRKEQAREQEDLIKIFDFADLFDKSGIRSRRNARLLAKQPIPEGPGLRRSLSAHEQESQAIENIEKECRGSFNKVAEAIEEQEASHARMRLYAQRHLPGWELVISPFGDRCEFRRR